MRGEFLSPFQQRKLGPERLHGLPEILGEKADGWLVGWVGNQVDGYLDGVR